MPSPQLGTRVRQGVHKGRLAQGQETRSHTRDVGMSKRVISTITFTTDGHVTGSNGDFTAFAAGDPVLIEGANLNNGFYEVTAIDGTNQAYIVVDPPPKAEGPVASVTVRTP